jgi:hypothetical protein
VWCVGVGGSVSGVAGPTGGFLGGLGFGTRALPGKLETRRQKLEMDSAGLYSKVGWECKGGFAFR